MALTYDEKIMCVKIWKGFSGEDTRPEQWNDQAAQLLAELVSEVRKCSASMHLVPQPPGRPTITWLLKHAARMLKDYLLGGCGTFEACKVFGYSKYRTLIKGALGA
jgi:hypothetical protein